MLRDTRSWLLVKYTVFCIREAVGLAKLTNRVTEYSLLPSLAPIDSDVVVCVTPKHAYHRDPVLYRSYISSQGILFPDAHREYGHLKELLSRTSAHGRGKPPTRKLEMGIKDTADLNPTSH